jgi:hypothetical protein
MPWRLQSLTLAGAIRATLGVLWHHGLPRPDHRPLAAHPTLSQDLYDHIDRGAIIPKPRIASLGERSVTFDDGTVEHVDLIVYCTGYKVSFPFFDPNFLAAPGNDLPLWRPGSWSIGRPNARFGSTQTPRRPESKTLAADSGCANSQAISIALLPSPTTSTFLPRMSTGSVGSR